jgi:hypothetical protein
MERPNTRKARPRVIVCHDLGGCAAVVSRGVVYVEDTGSDALNAIAVRIAIQRAQKRRK